MRLVLLLLWAIVAHCAQPINDEDQLFGMSSEMEHSSRIEKSHAIAGNSEVVEEEPETTVNYLAIALLAYVIFAILLFSYERMEELFAYEKAVIHPSDQKQMKYNAAKITGSEEID